MQDRRNILIAGGTGTGKTTLLNALAATIPDSDRIVLIVENDLSFAKVMLEVAREKGFKGLVTSLGAAALAMVREYKPDALTLDICLPDIDGWRVLERIKNDMNTRHIPVYVISTEECRERALQLGAVGVVNKPLKTRGTLEQAFDGILSFVSRPMRELMLVGCDPSRREQWRQLIGNGDVHTTAVDSGADAVQHLRQGHVDCVVVEPEALDGTADALLEAPPCIEQDSSHIMTLDHH